MRYYNIAAAAGIALMVAGVTNPAPHGGYVLHCIDYGNPKAPSCRAAAKLWTLTHGDDHVKRTVTRHILTKSDNPLASVLLNAIEP